MDERIERAIRAAGSLEALAQFEANARQRNALTDEVQAAITVRAAEFGREVIKRQTGLDLSDLSPAEERITQAIATYVGLKGGNASRTLLQVKNRGLIGAAETSVAKAVPSQGFQTLADEGREDLSYERIILEHPDEFSPRAIWYSRRTLGLPNDTAKPPMAGTDKAQENTVALLQWLMERRDQQGKIPIFDHAEAAAGIGSGDMRTHGRAFGNVMSRLDFACYRNGLPPLGLIAEPSFKDAWNQQGRSWAYPRRGMEAAARNRSWSDTELDAILGVTSELPGIGAAVWKREVAEREAAVRFWALGFSTDEPAPVAEAGNAYWVFVCNPKKWAIDKFLDSHIERDSWGVRPSDQNYFGPGQLGIIRVGVDTRTIAELDGRPRLDAGIYALCEVESTAYAATGASDDFWGDGERREAGWPTVKLRYLKSYLGNPLTISRLREDAPEVSRLLLDGFQAASFPIPAENFRRVMELLGERLDELPTSPDAEAQSPDALTAIEKKYLHASPEVKERVSKSIERGPVGAQVKKANGYKCQVCEALKFEPLGFKKRDGVHYVEAHHVTPVSLRQVGSLAASNIMTVCPNHHRQLHFGEANIEIAAATFDLAIDGVAISVARPGTTTN
jgi:hypothetical protein